MPINKKTTRHFATLLFALFFIVSLQSQLADSRLKQDKGVEEKLVGKWFGGGEEKDDNDRGYMIFDDEGGAVFEIDGQTIGGAGFEMEGIPLELTYEVAEDSSPLELDFVISSSGIEIARMKAIIIFIDDDTMRINLAAEPGTPRPTSFDEGDIARFERVKN